LLQRLQGVWCCVAWNAPDSVAPNQLCGWVGQEHGGSIPLAAVERTSVDVAKVPEPDSCTAANGVFIQSALIPADVMTFVHFSVSLRQNLAKS
jgi:hypothetical protein